MGAYRRVLLKLSGESLGGPAGKVSTTKAREFIYVDTFDFRILIDVVFHLIQTVSLLFGEFDCGLYILYNDDVSICVPIFVSLP